MTVEGHEFQPDVDPITCVKQEIENTIKIRIYVLQTWNS